VNEWWTKIDEEGLKIETKRTPVKDLYGQFADFDSKPEENSAAKLLKEFEEVNMTPALEMLMKSRRIKTEQEVEEDFNNR
jgi:hypothetical protein